MDFAPILAVLDPSVLAVIALGVAGGIVIGALPGLTATMGVALLIPMTFGMPPVSGLSMLMGIYVGAIYGGCICAILLKTPGTPASAATTLDGYPMAQNGQAGRALGLATYASGIGGLISALILITLAPQLARVALLFGPAEYFALAIFGLTIIASLSTDILRGFIIGFVGMLISTIGSDPISGFNRFTFGIPNLAGGIAFIPALIGLFAISEVLAQLETITTKKFTTSKIHHIFPSLADIKSTWKTALRGSIIGTIIGVIPGTGSNIAAWISYNEARRASNTPNKFGTGHADGIVATESANNAVCGGAMVPLLTLGLPGDSVTAVFLGGLIIHGLAPGPRLFIDNPEIISGLFTGIIIANIFMILLGFLAVRYSARLLNIPKHLLLPIIIVLCFLGAYSINQNIMDIFVMLFFGVIGYVCQKYNFSQSALCISMILGPIAEQNLRLTLIESNLDPSVFFTRPISLAFIVLAVASTLWALHKQAQRKV